ncbi:MAG: 50S ribosomal protein L21 [Candidatus Magnetobacterium sp. LHC-1]|uniref:Large ribosomal subunit protein bL21 n=1 Tax=Candidatus Magnetobacterium casense TaxID=1455061 RepID=A0ABS6S3F1_9BACT|nr:50S ribosomal protein L21 [Candidatus Magnetobacterium casensis]MBF0608455.1 50S ribosomal protein L21 [Nitrospirota bacterium]MBV6342933.1 50S ribosomal protein L21 [Candidatus Magnetobacterium casensis]
MFAIIETGGKQYKVSPEDRVKVGKLGPKEGFEVGHQVVIDKVLAISDNSKVTVGAPYVSGATVKGQVLSNGRTRKIEIFKMKPRKAHRKYRTHRQGFTILKIDEIVGGSNGS